MTVQSIRLRLEIPSEPSNVAATGSDNDGKTQTDTKIEELTLDSSLTGNQLKQQAYSLYKKRPDEQTLWFELPNEEGLKLVDDRKTLGDLGKLLYRL